MSDGFHKWEPVTAQTERMRVPGGWIYRTWQDAAEGLTFVPDPPVGPPVVAEAFGGVGGDDDA